MNCSYRTMTLQSKRQNEPSATLQSARQNGWYFRGVSPSTPANPTRQHSPVIRPKHWLPWGAVSANSPDKTDWAYGNKLRKEISWPDLITYSTDPHWVWPYHTYWSSGDLEMIKPQHVQQMHTLLGKTKPCKEQLFVPHPVFITEIYPVFLTFQKDDFILQN